jgi:hypothetical protein
VNDRPLVYYPEPVDMRYLRWDMVNGKVDVTALTLPHRPPCTREHNPADSLCDGEPEPLARPDATP